MISAAELLYQALLNIVNKYYEVIVTDNLSEETINQFKIYRNGLIIVTPILSKKQKPGYAVCDINNLNSRIQYCNTHGEILNWNSMHALCNLKPTEGTKFDFQHYRMKCKDNHEMFVLYLCDMMSNYRYTLRMSNQLSTEEMTNIYAQRTDPLCNRPFEDKDMFDEIITTYPIHYFIIRSIKGTKSLEELYNNSMKKYQKDINNYGSTIKMNNILKKKYYTLKNDFRKRLYQS